MYRIYLFIFFLTFSASKGIWAQTNLTALAFAEIIEALSANETDQLNFGRFMPESGGGSIVITPDGIRSSQGTVILASGYHSPGRFRLSGVPGASFSLQIPQAPVVLVHRTSGQTMMVDGWKSDPPSGEANATLTDGSMIINIGATLTVGSIEQNPPGLYAGSFQLTFAYN